MAYTVTIRDILFNTDTVACACLLLKAGTLGLRSQPKQQVVLVCQLKFDQLTNTVNRLVKKNLYDARDGYKDMKALQA